ncbi:hypothetical protein LSAT2_023284 [Lamellibrachia satsuma]|nr:hypothetical protein LSAT2_023284 [Lamellibrachia satsuma]
MNSCPSSRSSALTISRMKKLRAGLNRNPQSYKKFGHLEQRTKSYEILRQMAPLTAVVPGHITTTTTTTEK